MWIQVIKARFKEGKEDLRQTMAEIFDGPPEFLDLEVVADYEPGS